MRIGFWAFALAFGLTAIAAETLAAPQPTSPQAFLEAIYRPYLDKNFKGPGLDKSIAVRRYFTTPLANAILKDRVMAAKRKEIPTLDGDPFIDAQDWEMSNLKIEVNPLGTDKATGIVSFTNAGAAKTVTLDLVKTAGGWRIDEIRMPSGSLRKLMKLR